nr:probable leucine-rich repeat receptor-like protein kinase At1g35710 isoform X2 [Arachis hypogaea]
MEKYQYQLILKIVSLLLTVKIAFGEWCSSQDLEGLIGFKNGIQMDTSGRLAKWVGQRCCDWEGIVCDNATTSGTRRVTQIHLPGFISTDKDLFQTQMIGHFSLSITLLTSLEILDLGGLVGLSGTIPQTLGMHLQKLQKLYLYGNNLTGSIPESIGTLPLSLGNLTNLVELDLHENSINGHIPNSIGQMQNLEKLDLSSNLLNGRIPSSLSNLTSISLLYLDTNNLEGTIPFPSRNGGENMHSLGFLRLNDNNLSGNLPFNFGQLVSLQRVSLSNNKLEGALPSSLGNLHHLTEIYLSGNFFSGQIPKSLGQISHLIMFNISKNLIQGPLPKEMSNLQNLQKIDLSFNPLNLTSIPEWLPSLLSLSGIYLAGCGIQGRIPEVLNTIKSPIQELDLSMNFLSGSIPSWIGSFSQLYLLNLSRNSLDSFIPHSVAKLRNLAILDLHSNRLTGSIIEAFEIEQDSTGGSLTYLDLSHNNFSSGVEEIGVGGQFNIQFLNLSHNNLKGMLSSSLGRLKSIHSLDLSFNKLASNLPEFLANLTTLEILRLQKNHFSGNIPNAFLKLRKLKELDLSDNVLEGEIPEGEPLINFPGSSYSGNKGLCGKPLGPCKL